MTIRGFILAAIFSATAIAPGVAATCHLTIRGTLVLDDETCTASTRGATTTITTDNGAVLAVRRSVLSASLPLDPSAGTGRRTYRRVSYGQVVKSNNTDDKLCYFNQTAVLCIESGGLLKF